MQVSPVGHSSPRLHGIQHSSCADSGRLPTTVMHDAGNGHGSAFEHARPLIDGSAGGLGAARRVTSPSLDGSAGVSGVGRRGAGSWAQPPENMRKMTEGRTQRRRLMQPTLSGFAVSGPKSQPRSDWFDRYQLRAGWLKKGAEVHEGIEVSLSRRHGRISQPHVRPYVYA